MRKLANTGWPLVWPLLNMSHLPFAAIPSRNNKPSKSFEADGFFCLETEVERKWPQKLWAISDYWAQEMAKKKQQLPIIIATDGTEASQKQFEWVKEHFLKRGFDVYTPFSKIDQEFPMTIGTLSYYTKNFHQLEQPSKQVAGAVYITVGQNPYGMVGFRVMKPNGALADPEMSKSLNTLIQYPEYLKTGKNQPGEHHQYHFRSHYYEYLSKVIDLRIIGKAYRDIFHDALTGATGYYFKKIVEPTIKFIRQIRDCFMHPVFRKDKIYSKYGYLMANDNLKFIQDDMAQLQSPVKLGFVNDTEGAATRVISEKCQKISPSNIVLLLLNHFVSNKQRSGRIIKTHDTSDAIDELALKFGFPIIEVPGDFKTIQPLLGDAKEPILLAADGTGKLTGLNFLPVADGQFTNIALLEALGADKNGIPEMLNVIQQKSLFHYTHKQYVLKGNVESNNRTFEALKHLAQYGGYVGNTRVDILTTIRHNNKMKKMGPMKNEFKIFFKDGSWVVVHYGAWEVKLTIETRTIRQRFNYFGQNSAEKEHYYFVNQLKEHLHYNSLKEI